MDPLTLTGLTAAGTAVVLAASGHADLLRPPAPSPAAVRRVARLTAAGGLAAGVALTGTGSAVADQLPPDIPASVVSAAPGPDNQAPLPDGRPWMDAVTPWGTTDQHATTLPAAEAAAPKRPARTTRMAGPKRPRTWPARRAVRSSIVVRPGDTLSGIAAAHGTTVRALVRANTAAHPSLATNPDLIQAGWTLRLPGGAR